MYVYIYKHETHISTMQKIVTLWYSQLTDLSITICINHTFLWYSALIVTFAIVVYYTYHHCHHSYHSYYDRSARLVRCSMSCLVHSTWDDFHRGICVAHVSSLGWHFLLRCPDSNFLIEPSTVIHNFNVCLIVFSHLSSCPILSFIFHLKKHRCSRSSSICFFMFMVIFHIFHVKKSGDL